ncbi:DUF6694 family lipoprotein [Halomonas sp. AOP27-A1-34]|uniref:DUF6694 family lipoprotein n=1 Tax=Halomonas sp. AOP27-A1-34 TaxID=3457708 RepID=UPI004034AA21
MRLLLVVALSMAMLSTACADPTIDGSNQRQFESSLEEVRATLNESEVERFNEALAGYMMRTMMAGRNILEFGELNEDEMEELYNEARQSLHGLTAEEVLARVQGEAPTDTEEVSDVDASVAQEMLDRFEIEHARYFVREESYTRGSPVIELRVTNNTGEPVSRGYFRGILQTPGRSVPWVDETFNYSIAGGIEPGETLEWSLAPNQFGPWGNSSIPDDAVLNVEVIRLDGPSGEPLWQAP